MKYPKYKKGDGFTGFDHTDKNDVCVSSSCDKGYSIYCIGRIPCWGDCSNCRVRTTPIWRGRCQCYQRRMKLEEESK